MIENDSDRPLLATDKWLVLFPTITDPAAIAPQIREEGNQDAPQAE